MAFNFRDGLFSQIFSIETEPELIKMAETLRQIHDMSNEQVISNEEYNSILEEAILSLRIKIGNSFVIESENKLSPWFENYYKNLGHTRWDRYEYYLLNSKNFPKNVVRGMNDNLKRIIELSGNPNGNNNYLRKGLIVGDVQSGKTANYVGLMNLASDVKYKVIIVLTGTTNALREQTQIRIEEGLGKANLEKGVNSIPNYDFMNFAHPVYLTSRDQDFSVSSKKNFQASVESTTEPVVIVTKKNSTSLKNIYEWLVTYSKRKQDNKIDYSLMLIDDESDFASVNTREDDNPTVINKRIREILNLFTKSSYIGFTATPYANIFIEPQTDDEMYGQDLFPSDYIYVLGESDNYVGIQSVFDDEPKYPNMLQEIESREVESYLLLKHKKNEVFNQLAPSMIHAINVFFIANTIRDLRGHKTSHRSMLLNISRFINVHNQIRDVVIDYLEEAKRNVRVFSKLPYDEACKNHYIMKIKESFDIEYMNKIDDSIKFEEVLDNLNDAIYRIKVAVVNSNNKELAYLQNEAEGERVIVIGGFALSRGLTLEGLLVSYYYRNSVMYDSLLQMGRWFGYRDGYSDLCRIFMTESVIDDFKFISLATKELKDDLKINSSRGLTPLDFGIKVRTGHVGLVITSRNKMRSSQDIITRANFNKDIIETTVFSIDEQKYIDPNISLIKELVSRNYNKFVSDMYPGRRDSHGLRNVEKEEIIWFLNKYVSVDVSSKFDSKLIIRWLEANSVEELDNWDIAFAEGSIDDIKYNYNNLIVGSSIKRKIHLHGKNTDNYRTSSSRLGSPSDGRYGLSKEQVEIVKQIHKGIGSNKEISQKEYFIKDLNRKPIIMIYNVVPSLNDKNLLNMYVPLISIGIPELDFSKTQYVEYKVNKIYRDLEFPETEEE